LALDGTSRILIFEAVKRWRQNKTTIVITHDLSQISATDFTYVLKEGAVVERGYRGDLEVAGGEFQQMAMIQAEAGGFALNEEQEYSPKAVFQRDEDAETIFRSRSVRSLSVLDNRESMATKVVTFGNWIFEVVSDLTRSGLRATTQPTMVAEQGTTHMSRFVPVEAFVGGCPPVSRERRPSTLAIDIPSPTSAHTTVTRRVSLEDSPVYSVYSLGLSDSSTVVDNSDYSEDKKEAFSHVISSRRPSYGGASLKHEQKRWDAIKVQPFEGRTVKAVTVEQPPQVDTPQESLFFVLRGIYRTIPFKPLIALGTVFAVISGSMHPIFSFILSRLVFEMSKGAQDVSIINAFGGIVLAVAIANGVFAGLKSITLETAGQLWVSRLRTICYPLVLAQDKRWFDRCENAASEMCQVLVDKGNGACLLISTAIPQSIVYVSMLTVSLIGALALGWQLALVGFGIGLVFLLAMVLQSRLVAGCEARNKRAREEVARDYCHVSL
jgi:ATP-binding cassette subfamily B (MDR/TAP) protein 1